VANVEKLLNGTRSAEALVTEATFKIEVPRGMFVPTFTTRENTATAPGSNVGVEAIIIPLEPTGGEVIAQPTGPEIDVKVVPEGRISAKDTET
jgi:hypothetical protein